MMHFLKKQLRRSNRMENKTLRSLWRQWKIPGTNTVKLTCYNSWNLKLLFSIHLDFTYYKHHVFHQFITPSVSAKKFYNISPRSPNTTPPQAPATTSPDLPTRMTTEMGRPVTADTSIFATSLPSTSDSSKTTMTSEASLSRF